MTTPPDARQHSFPGPSPHRVWSEGLRKAPTEPSATMTRKRCSPNQESTGRAPANHVHHSEDATEGALLGIWAHPDDEAYLSAGLMFRAAASAVVGLPSRPPPRGSRAPTIQTPGRPIGSPPPANRSCRPASPRLMSPNTVGWGTRTERSPKFRWVKVFGRSSDCLPRFCPTQS